MSTAILGPNSEDVVADVVEGEAVIINVATGIYYSTRGIGGWVWDLVAQEAGYDHIVRSILAAYDVDEENARKDLDLFLADLRRETLVIDKPAASAPVPSLPRGKGDPYVRPELVAYRDLKDLLALDPPMPRMVD